MTLEPDLVKDTDVDVPWRSSGSSSEGDFNRNSIGSEPGGSSRVEQISPALKKSKRRKKPVKKDSQLNET